MRRIAVAGGGLFGATAAIRAARAGYEVHLFELKPGLMMGATAGCYARLHRGFHYPRSPETGRESRRAEFSFRSEYGDAVIDGGEQTYIVAHGGRISRPEFREFLDREDLYFSERSDGVFTVTEPRVDLGRLSEIVRHKADKAGVNLHLGEPLPADARSRFDHVIVAAYSGINAVLESLGCKGKPYKFQVVERPLVRLPETFIGRSIVVIDGPFGCVDPFDRTGRHVLGHVVHTVHAENVGMHPEIPDGYADMIDAGLVTDRSVSRIGQVVDGLARHIPGARAAEYIGSSYVVRAVLAHVEDTDKRPTLVERIDDQVSTIFSGKLGTAVRAAEEALNGMARPAAMRAA